MRVRRRVCRACKVLWRNLVTKVTLKKLFWTISVLFFLSVLICWITEEEEVIPIPIQNYEKPKNVTRKRLKIAHNPPIIWWNQGYRLNDETITCSENLKCDAYSAYHILPPGWEGAYLFYASRLVFDDLPLPRNTDKVLWALSHEESPRNVVELLHEPALNLFNYSSTFSRFSDVPFPLQTLESVKDITDNKHFVKTSVKNELANELAPIIFMSSSCYTFTDRDGYVKELMKYIPIDSYGSCLNNKKWPVDYPEDYLNSMHDERLLNFIARYKFAIAIENGVCDDYITEKFWRPIKLGTVPIYFGSPTIKDWYPNNKSAILTSDFPSPESLSNYLYKLINNDTLYEEYLEHKTRRLISNKNIIEELEARPYQMDIERTSLELECFICKKLHVNKKKIVDNIVTKSHYNCSKPISALTGKVMESEIPFWEQSKRDADILYKRVQRLSHERV